MKKVDLRVKLLPHASGMEMPCYMSEGASGLDLRAAVEESRVIRSGEWQLIPTGISVSLPQGFEAQIRPRSGLALRHGITCLNSPGTIDSDYRGEISIILINLGKEPFVIERGMRIAQMVVAEVVQAELCFDDCLDATTRGHGGFGHTGA